MVKWFDLNILKIVKSSYLVPAGMFSFAQTPIVEVSGTELVGLRIRIEGREFLANSASSIRRFMSDTL